MPNIKLINRLNQNSVREFVYAIQLPDGMRLYRRIPPTQFTPGEKKFISLGDPIFLGFVGIMRVVLLTGEAERLFIQENKLPTVEGFLTLFVGYSRDKEGHELQKRIRCLTGVLVALTFVLVVLTAVLILK